MRGAVEAGKDGMGGDLFAQEGGRFKVSIPAREEYRYRARILAKAEMMFCEKGTELF